MSRYLGKSLASTIQHSNRTKMFRAPAQEMNRFIDARSNNQYEYFQPYDTPYRVVATDEYQDYNLLALDIVNASSVSDKCNSFYFEDSKEEKTEAYHKEDMEDKRLDTDIISQQFHEMQISAHSFYDVELNETKFELSSGSPDPTTEPSVPSLLEKIAGITKDEMVYMFEKNCFKYESLMKSNVSASCN